MRTASLSAAATCAGLSIAAAASVILTGTATVDAQDAATGAAVTANAKALPRQVVDMHHLMELFNRPVYEYMKKAVSQQPSEEKGWKEIADRGLQVAEVANLVAMRDRIQSHPQGLELAGDLQEAGKQLAEAAKSEDWSATQAAYRHVIQQCNDCHQTMAPDAAPTLAP